MEFNELRSLLLTWVGTQFGLFLTPFEQNLIVSVKKKKVLKKYVRSHEVETKISTC